MCFDCAVSEAFNSVLKGECVHGYAFAARTDARIKIAIRITDFCSTRRLCRKVSMRQGRGPRVGEGLSVDESLVGVALLPKESGAAPSLTGHHFPGQDPPLTVAYAVHIR